MITLRAKTAAAHLSAPLERSVWMLTDGAAMIGSRAARAVLVGKGETPEPGFPLYVLKSGVQPPLFACNWIEVPEDLGYLAPGDVLAIADDGRRVHAIWRRNSMQNSVLLTERCDNYCLMCSQPPKRDNDDFLLQRAVDLIRVLPPNTPQIAFTGGEPTFYGDQLVDILKLCKALIPQAGVHVLSNGRRFHDPGFAAAWATIDHPELMVGIPIYGAEPSMHDYVVQAQGAFDQTVRGILNLARLEQRIEIRVVIHKQTAPVLLEIVEFISRNLPFVDQVALMGLEMTGFARANMREIWIDPIEYQSQLTEAAMLLDARGIPTMIYNHQLCLLEPAAWPFAVKSISDWKNDYLHDECQACSVRERCGGFFTTGTRISEHIMAIHQVAS